MRTAKVISISLPSDMTKEIQEIIREERRSVSAVRLGGISGSSPAVRCRPGIGRCAERRAKECQEEGNQTL